MAALKTTPNDRSIEAFLDGIGDEKKKRDSYRILELMRQVTGEEAQMWGDSIVGFGSYHYKYASRREGDWFLTGFSPRKQAITLYIMAGFDQYEALMSQLGYYKTGKSCLYIKKLEDIDLPTLCELVKQSVEHMVKTNP